VRNVLILCLCLSPAIGCGASESDTKQAVPAPGDPAFVRDPKLDVENISKSGERKSHNVGRNCMECHQAKGPGKGRFRVAGSLFVESTRAPSEGGVLELRAGPKPDAALVLRVEVDALGNFFSTEALPFPDQALFPSVKNADGSLVNAMPFPTISGACNQCHVRGNLVDLKPPVVR
jgi:hypothetical protein